MDMILFQRTRTMFEKNLAEIFPAIDLRVAGRQVFGKR